VSEGRKDTGETAGKEFAITILIKDIFEASPDPRAIDITYPGKGGTKESPDMSVALKREGDGTHSIEQQLGKLSGVEAQVNDQWGAKIDEGGRVDNLIVNGVPVEIIDEMNGATSEAQMDRATANAKVVGALQSLRTLVLPGVF
jgi:hypothetical protein